MNSFNPAYFPHAANVLLLVAYSVLDILWLRLQPVSLSLLLGEAMETSASFEARSAPLPYPT
jgi:hypothetical protein